MILVKTPLRLSFFGGGSDLPSHFETHGGATLSATFDKSIYIGVMRTPQDHIKVSYATTEIAKFRDEVKHTIIKAALEKYEIRSNIEITSFADIPTVGTGLGASSAFAVGLVQALNRYTNKQTATPLGLTKSAIDIEINRCKSPIGYQDHIAAAFGGCLHVEYRRADSFVPLTVNLGDFKTELEQSLLLIQVPERTHSANEILHAVADRTSSNGPRLNRLANMTAEALQVIRRRSIQDFGTLLHEAWQEKKELSPHITTGTINLMYDWARENGAIGGKLLGAGSGGFLLMCSPNAETTKKLQTVAFPTVTCYPVKLTGNRSEVVYDDTR